MVQRKAHLVKMKYSSNGSTVRRHRCRSISGFSLIELLIVLAIAALLIGLLMPHFTRIREMARQAACASNMHQIGIGLSIYLDENWEQYPASYFSGSKKKNRPAQPLEMNTVQLGRHKPLDRVTGWDGIGWLYYEGMVRSPQVYYCPSHIGSNPFENYQEDWANPTEEKTDLIRINYHYRNKIDSTVLVNWQRDNLHRLHMGKAIVMDGLRTKSDFNHGVGANYLRVDSAVRWFDDPGGQIYDSLPTGDESEPRWGMDPWKVINSRP